MRKFEYTAIMHLARVRLKSSYDTYFDALLDINAYFVPKCCKMLFFIICLQIINWKSTTLGSEWATQNRTWPLMYQQAVFIDSIFRWKNAFLVPEKLHYVYQQCMVILLWSVQSMPAIEW